MIKEQRSVLSSNRGIKSHLNFLLLLIILTESCHAFANFIPSSEVNNETTIGSEDFLPFEKENEMGMKTENDSQEGIVHEILPSTTIMSPRKSRRTEIGEMSKYHNIDLLKC